MFGITLPFYINHFDMPELRLYSESRFCGSGKSSGTRQRKRRQLARKTARK